MESVIRRCAWLRLQPLPEAVKVHLLHAPLDKDLLFLERYWCSKKMEEKQEDFSVSETAVSHPHTQV